jgi:hypothetical protein
VTKCTGRGRHRRVDQDLLGSGSVIDFAGMGPRLDVLLEMHRLPVNGGHGRVGDCLLSNERRSTGT